MPQPPQGQAPLRFRGSVGARGRHALVVGLVHPRPGEQAGGGGERGDHGGGGADAVGVGEYTGEQGADGEAAVAPQSVDANGAGAPGGVGDVADGGEQGGVDHGGAGAEQHGRGRPGGERAGRGDPGQRRGLQEHAGDDQGFAAVAVGEGAGGQVAERPDGGEGAGGGPGLTARRTGR